MAISLRRRLRQLLRVAAGRSEAAASIARATGLDTTATWIDPNGRRLKDRVWLARQRVRDQIDHVLLTAMATGADAQTVAAALQRYLAPGRAARGRLPGAVGNLPGVAALLGGKKPFAGAAPARLLVRDSVGRAHATAVLWASQRNPLVEGIAWRLSHRHPKQDECDVRATQNLHGLGPGIYPPDRVPPYPVHPHDLCHLSPVMTRAPARAIGRLFTRLGL